jgi:hypothetical protein
MDQEQSTAEQANNQSDEPMQTSTMLWGIAAIGLSILMLTFNNAHMVVTASFLSKFFAFFVGTLGGWLGVFIGDAIRQFALPDSFYTSGGMGSIIKTKLFWAIGPQLIGLCIGVAMGISIVLS